MNKHLALPALQTIPPNILKDFDYPGGLGENGRHRVIQFAIKPERYPRNAISANGHVIRCGQKAPLFEAYVTISGMRHRR